MSSYWAKRRRVNKLVRDTEQDILTDYNLAAANSNLTADSNANLHCSKSTNPVTTSSECPLDLPTTSDLPLNRPPIREGPPMREDDPIQSENENGSDSEENSEDLLMTSLKYWATNYSISLVALSSLLCILKTFHPTLPKDGRTLLGTQKHVPTTKIEGGEYYHFGIVKGVLSRLACLSLPATLTTFNLQFNIDGLPLFKSSKLQFWPILGCLKCDYSKSPFVVGIFCGLCKPKSVSEYLEQFVKDLQNVVSNGISYNGKLFNVHPKMAEEYL